ncbi:unnamed protein product [Schistosoma mattheei]|uniref:Uncharacterized protein n=1 Tax=Schistosoma mattheei TaxID=31246 RepID=A0A183PQT9_9TREM|nr:unnamed protein product [Schistosoma mattheei]
MIALDVYEPNIEEGVVVKLNFESTHLVDVDDVEPAVHSLQFRTHHEHGWENKRHFISFFV